MQQREVTMDSPAWKPQYGHAYMIEKTDRNFFVIIDCNNDKIVYTGFTKEECEKLID